MGKSINNSPVSKAKKARRGPAKKKTKTEEPAKTRILKAIAFQKSIGNEQPSRDMIQGLAVMESKGSFGTTILNMKKKDETVDYDSKTIWLTEAGIAEVGEEACSTPASNEGIQKKLKEQIPHKKSREIFDIMTDGDWCSKAELLEAMNHEDNKSFGTYLSALSKFVDKENGKMRLKQIAFPCGRPCEM